MPRLQDSEHARRGLGSTRPLYTQEDPRKKVGNISDLRAVHHSMYAALVGGNVEHLKKSTWAACSTSTSFGMGPTDPHQGLVAICMSTWSWLTRTATPTFYAIESNMSRNMGSESPL